MVQIFKVQNAQSDLKGVQSELKSVKFQLKVVVFLRQDCTKQAKVALTRIAWLSAEWRQISSEVSDTGFDHTVCSPCTWPSATDRKCKESAVPCTTRRSLTGPSLCAIDEFCHRSDPIPSTAAGSH